MKKNEECYDHKDSLYKNFSINENNALLTLVGFYKGNGGKLLFAIFLFFIKNAHAWLVPIFTARIINIASQPTKHNINEIWFNLVIIFILYIQNVPTHTLHTRYLSLAVRCVEASLRSTMIRKLQQLSISYHKDMESGRLQSKILRDVEAIEFLSKQLISTFVPAAINITLAIIITTSKNYMVSLFFLFTIPISLLLVKLFRNSIQARNREFRKEIEAMSARVSEMVEMIPITRAHGLEKVEVKKIDNHLEKMQSKGYRLDILNAVYGSASNMTFLIFQALCLAFTGYMAYNGKIQIGDVVMYQGYFNGIVGYVSNILNIYPNVVKGFESIHSVAEILTVHDTENNRGKLKLKNIEGHFAFKDVEFTYPKSEEPVIKDFNLEVKHGECIAIVGESGAGKSSILNLIIGFNKPNKGNLLIDGMDISKIDLRSYRKFLAVVPQNNILFSGSILDNITYGLPTFDDNKIQEIIDLANIREFVAKLPKGLNTQVGEHGGKLSGGQRQRIAIARALIRDPKVIIFDEATSALDYISEHHVQIAMKQLLKGRTTFIVAHRLSTIREADRIVVMKNGICVEVGTYEELMNRQGEFYKMKVLQA